MWIVRDRDGSLWIHVEKPRKNIFCWTSKGESEPTNPNFFPRGKMGR